MFGVSHTGVDEVVIKCPLPNDEINPNLLFIGMMEESLMLKLCPLKSHICEVKEELIEYNYETKKVISYCVVVERATNSLKSLIHDWNSSAASS